MSSSKMLMLEVAESIRSSHSARQETPDLWAVPDPDMILPFHFDNEGCRRRGTRVQDTHPGVWEFLSIAVARDPKRVHTTADTLESIYWSTLHAAARANRKQTNGRGPLSIRDALMQRFPCAGVMPCYECSPCIARHDRFPLLQAEATAPVKSVRRGWDVMVSVLLKELGMVFHRYNARLRSDEECDSDEDEEEEEKPEVEGQEKKERKLEVPTFEQLLSIFDEVLENGNMDFTWYCIQDSVEMREAW